MKKYGAFNEAKLSQITPNGWFEEYLKAAKNGLPGHLQEIGYPFDTSCWSLKSLADGGYAQWWPYEQSAYWIDSVARSSMLLGDEEFYDVVKSQIDASLENAEDDGFIGPIELEGDGNRFQWPHAVYFRALYAIYSKTGDMKYVNAMVRHYLAGFRDYSVSRDVANIETILRLYEITGNEKLKELAYSSYEKFNELSNDDSTLENMASSKRQTLHGVSFNEQGKIAAVMYIYFGEKRFLDAVVNAYEKVEHDHVMPDGVHSSCEGFRGKKIMEVAHETCDITDYSWALGYLLEATGDGKYADRIEKACLNASLGAVGPDFRTMQYFSNINQVIAARNSTHIDSFVDTPRMAYQPHHYPECCVGNVGRAIPNYIARSYYQSENGIFAVLYGDSTFSANGLTIKQTGNYPFTDTVTFRFSCDNPVKTGFSMRIPQWAVSYEIKYNGEIQNVTPHKGFASIQKEFKDGDIVILTLKKELKHHISAENGVYFEYGPLLMSLKIKEDWQIDETEKRQTEEFPAYNVYPSSRWNYAVSGDEDYTVTVGKIGKTVWWDSYPYEIKLKAHVLLGWDIDCIDMPTENETGEGIDAKQIALGATKVMDKQLELTPCLPDKEYIDSHLGETEEITLVPFGCTQLRLTVFPRIEK